MQGEGVRDGVGGGGWRSLDPNLAQVRERRHDAAGKEVRTKEGRAEIVLAERPSCKVERGEDKGLATG